MGRPRKSKADPMAEYTGAKDMKDKRPRLASETRVYTVDEAELSEWLAGSGGFRVEGIRLLGADSVVEFTVSSGPRKATPVKVERIRESLDPPTTSAAEAGPQIVDDDDSLGPVGKADAEPMIAGKNEGPRARLKSRRELNLEARKQGRPEMPNPRITERSADEDDPVPSALPR